MISREFSRGQSFLAENVRGLKPARETSCGMLSVENIILLQITRAHTIHQFRPVHKGFACLCHHHCWRSICRYRHIPRVQQVHRCVVSFARSKRTANSPRPNQLLHNRFRRSTNPHPWLNVGEKQQTKVEPCSGMEERITYHWYKPSLKQFFHANDYSQLKGRPKID